MVPTSEFEVSISRRSSRDHRRYRNVIAWPEDVDGGGALDDILLCQPSLRVKPYDARADLAIRFSTQEYRLRFSVVPTTSEAPQTWRERHRFAHCLGIALYEKFDDLLSDVTCTARRYLTNYTPPKSLPLTGVTVANVLLGGLPGASAEPTWPQWIPEAPPDVDTYERAVTMTIPRANAHLGTPMSRVRDFVAYFERFRPTIAHLRYADAKAESVQTAH